MTMQSDRNDGNTAIVSLAAATLVGIAGLLLNHSPDGARTALLWFLIPVTIGGVMNVVERTNRPDKSRAYWLSIAADLAVTGFIATVALGFSFAPASAAQFPKTPLGPTIMVGVGVALIYSMIYKTVARRADRTRQSR